MRVTQNCHNLTQNCHNLTKNCHNLTPNRNPVKGVMCRDTISVGWDGVLYDCDFNQQLAIPLGEQPGALDTAHPPHKPQAPHRPRTVFDIESLQELVTWRNLTRNCRILTRNCNFLGERTNCSWFALLRLHGWIWQFLSRSNCLIYSQHEFICNQINPRVGIASCNCFLVFSYRFRTTYYNYVVVLSYMIYYNDALWCILHILLVANSSLS